MLESQVYAREVRRRLWNPPNFVREKPSDGWEKAKADFERAQAIDDLVTAEKTTVPAVVENENEEAGPRLPKLEEIQRVVCRFYGLDRRGLLSARRDRKATLPRQVAMFIAKQTTLRSLTEIGRRFHRDHTTVCYAAEKITQCMESDIQLCAEIDDIKRTLGVG